ncbi:putative protease [Algoriphagus machipongonensis]|uniref:Protease n=2 Tax=Algoriphagus machipongonensis TaxID=388413 RepID=A3HX72_9BACT|nr:putative protease [Algoriphagus machipongonensis]
MHKYTLRCPNPNSQFLQIQLEFTAHSDGTQLLQLPSWRAGRYQLANYAQFIRKFIFTDSGKKSVKFQKTSKDCWSFEGKKNENYLIEYDFFCARMDAGGAWIDEKQVYINFINCCFEVKDATETSIFLTIDIPSFDQIICTLPKQQHNTWIAQDYQMLVDSTLLATNKITHWVYQTNESLFNIWIQGSIHFDKESFIENFKKFTSTQIRDFGEFPEQEYHFIFQLLPYKHYHGVEHQKGTVITYGPAESLSNPDKMEDLLGVSAHELYHAWNVCRIRPAELLPYDFSKETYTKAGWVLEGVTTYMGDLYLLKSGVYSLEIFLKQIETTLKREIVNSGWENHTILDSSFDLWLDGYQPGIPDRKVNIYTHGCLISYCLDLMLLEQGSSLPHVMRLAWEKFGKPRIGYTASSFWNLIISQANQPEDFQIFYKQFIEGNENLLEFFFEKMKGLGIKVHKNQNADNLAAKIGVLSQEGRITKIHQNSPAFSDLMIGDRIKSEEIGNKLLVKVERINGSDFEFSYDHNGDYYPEILLLPEKETELRKKWME